MRFLISLVFKMNEIVYQDIVNYVKSQLKVYS